MAYRNLLTIVVALTMAVVVQASDEGTDKMKGIGMPIMFLATLTLAAVLSRAHLMDAVGIARSDINVGIAFLVSLATVILSVFIYFTAGFAYGLISTLIAYINMVGVSRSREFAMHNLGLHVVWFCILIGIPNHISDGIINAVSLTNCKAFYPNYSDTMCKDGWVIFVSIVSCVLIGMTLTSLLSLINQAAAAPSTGTYSPVRGEDGPGAPLRQNEYAPPQSEYQKVTQS